MPRHFCGGQRAACRNGLSFHDVCSGGQTWIIRLIGKHLYFIGPVFRLMREYLALGFEAERDNGLHLQNARLLLSWLFQHSLPDYKIANINMHLKDDSD